VALLVGVRVFSGGAGALLKRQWLGVANGIVVIAFWSTLVLM
jgi:hypothetical protein